MLIVEIPGEVIRKFYPAHDSLGYGFRYSDAPFLNERLLTSEVRRFPLENQTLFLPLEDDTPYESALALLVAIESGTAATTKAPRLTLQFDQIISIQQVKDGILEIRTRTRPFGGNFFHFRKLPDGTFESTGGGSWVS